jgi:hypothetical protein
VKESQIEIAAWDGNTIRHDNFYASFVPTTQTGCDTESWPIISKWLDPVLGGEKQSSRRLQPADMHGCNSVQIGRPATVGASGDSSDSPQSKPATQYR